MSGAHCKRARNAGYITVLHLPVFYFSQSALWTQPSYGPLGRCLLIILGFFFGFVFRHMWIILWLLTAFCLKYKFAYEIFRPCNEWRSYVQIWYMVIFPPIAAGVQTCCHYSSISRWIHFSDMLTSRRRLFLLEHFKYFMSFSRSGRSFRPLFWHHKIRTVSLPQRTDKNVSIVQRCCSYYSSVNPNVN